MAALALLLLVGANLIAPPLGFAQGDDGGRLTFRARPHVEVESASITLADIFEIYSEGPLDIDLLIVIEELLEREEIGSAPEPGYDRQLSPDYPVRELKNLHLAEEHGIEVEVEAEERIRVERATQHLDPREIEERAVEHVEQQLETEGSGRVEIEVSGLPSEMAVPAGAMEILPAEEGSSAMKNLPGRTTLPVEIRVDGEQIREVFLQLEVGLYQPVLVASERLKRGEAIAADEVAREERNLADLRSEPLSDLEQIEGLQVARSVSAGTVLTDDLLERPPLVRRGDTVQIVARQGAVQVTARGEAREDGYREQKIRVRNAASDKIIEALVVDEGKVQVTF